MDENYLHKFGVVTGTTAGAQMPDVRAQRVRLQASNANFAAMKIGDSVNNIVWELAVGEEIDLFPALNLNVFYLSAVSGIHDRLIYWILN